MHQKPDADAMGSSLGLFHFLKQFGHSITVISPTNWADWLKWMPGCETVIDYELNTEKANIALHGAQFLFCLDFNTFSRTRKMERELNGLHCTKILIDHHQEPVLEVFDYGISDVSKSSTSEMVYDFINASGHRNKINEAIAECLYAGVMTDTGSFRFSSATADVHRMVADLKTTGFNHSQIHENLFDNFLENRLRFIGHVLQNRMEIYYEHNSALIAVPWKDLVKFDIKTGDTEGLVNYPLSIKGIKLAALIIDRDEEIRCSFRSKGNFDVNGFARKYFEGGGHFNAAGGRSRETLEATVQRFILAMKENTSQLQ
ncbi:MAG: bifunctional oligoribonuclease/PAP phosphatase NrnA [Bacteroidetes bacterium]|nr:bifunctional oligoribonuclease/PAP phosphatase NrnA [Bacteroidota bacterium]MBS1973397.1 bifunctional oligoribonuclease/PAP phosphatase NrnA [Bacteroidota bacterium]